MLWPPSGLVTFLAIQLTRHKTGHKTGSQEWLNIQGAGRPTGEKGEFYALKFGCPRMKCDAKRGRLLRELYQAYSNLNLKY